MIKSKLSISNGGWFNLGLLVLFVTACCPDVDQNLNTNIAAWAPYQTNQEIVFQNNNQDSVKFKVRRMNRLESGYDRVCGSYDIETAEAILINQADTAFQLKIKLTQEVLVKLDSYYLLPPAKNLEVMFNSVTEQYISDDWRDHYVKEITLQGKTYKNVLHVYANNSPNSISFNEMYYSKDSGLVAFHIMAGGWFYVN